MAFGNPQLLEYGQIETDDIDPRKKRYKGALRRIRRRVLNQDGSADVVSSRATEIGADLDLRVACGALNFQASKANSNFRIFNDDFSTALLTKRIRMQQRIAGNWENLDLPFTAHRTVTRNGRGQDFAAWGWRYRTGNVGVMNVIYEQELGASKWSYDFRNLGAASGEFRIVQRVVLLVEAQNLRPIYRQNGLGGPRFIAGYTYRFATGERISVDWSDQDATGDFASVRADSTLTPGSGFDILSTPFTLAPNESKLIDPTYTSDAGWSGHAVGSGGGAWVIDGGSGNSNGMGQSGGVEIRTVMRFPTTTVPTTATIDGVTLEFQTVNVNAMAHATILFRIGPHAGDGRTDPEPETFSASWTNADNSGYYYVNGITALRSTGAFSQLLGSTANSDLQSARGASVAFFSLSLNAYNGGGNTYSQPAAYNNSTGSYQPNLVIEYTEAGGTQYDRSISPSVSASATLSRASSRLQSISASATASAVSAPLSSRVLAISTSLIVSVVLGLSSARFIAISSSVSIAASLAVLFVRLASIAGGVSVSAEVSRALAYVVAIAAITSSSASIASISSRLRDIAASVTASASLSMQRAHLLGIVASVAMAAAVVASPVVLYYAAISAAVSLVASFAILVARYRSIATGISVATVLSPLITAFRSISVGVSTSSTVANARAYLRSISASVASSAVIDRASVVLSYVSISASTVASSSLSILMAHYRTVSTSVSTSVTFSRLMSLSRSISASVAASSLVSRGMTLFRSISAATSLSAVVEIRRTILRSMAVGVSFLAGLISAFIPGGTSGPTTVTLEGTGWAPYEIALSGDGFA